MFNSTVFSNTLLSLLFASFASIYFYVKYLFSYWQRRGVPYIKPSFPFGNFGKNFMQKTAICVLVDEFYCSTIEPFIGVYALFRPNLIIRDPDLARHVLIKDFNHFVDRGVYSDEENDPLSGHLFALPGDKWKNLRVKLTPTFTSGKMKAIFTTLLDCKNPLQNYIRKVADTNESVVIREVAALFTTNAIASVAFGLDIDCFADPNSPFREYGRRIQAPGLKNSFRFSCFFLCPSLLKWTGLHIVDRDVEEFFFNIVRQTLEMRETNHIVRKDFFQLLVQLRNTGNVQLDDEWQTIITNGKTKALSVEEIVGQAFIFYVAGFEPTATTIAFALYEMAKQPDIQRKVHEEIDSVLAENDGQFSYHSINELKYLDCCMDETLRLYPVVHVLSRECTKEYIIPGMNVTIEKGTQVTIPTFSLQRDEQFYPDPLKFDPTRFFSENRNGKTIIDMPYLPFGDGQRNCIGLRMGKMSTKLGIAAILQEHSVELDEQFIGKEIEFDPTSGIPAAKVNIKLKIKKRQSTL